MNEIAYPLTQIMRYTCMQLDKVVYYCQPLPDPIPNTDKKLKIYTWLRALSPQQLEQVLSFTSYFRVNSFLKMFKLDQKQIHEYLELNYSPFTVNVKNELCQYYYVRDCHRLDVHQIEAQKYILDITYITDLEWLFDTIILKGDIEKIIDCFELVSKGTIFTKKESIDTREEEEYSEINFRDTKIPCTLAELIVIQIEKAILIKFYQFEQHTNYTKQDNLFNFNEVQLNFQDINFQQEYQSFSSYHNDLDQKFIDEKCLLAAWNLHVKCENILIHQIQSQISLFTQHQEWIFEVPLKYTTHEALLFCKYLATKQLKLLYPLKKPPEEVLVSQKKQHKLKELKIFQEKQDKPIKQQIQLKQVSQYFTNLEKSKILPENEQRLFSTNKEEHEQQLYEFSTQFVKRVFDTVITELEHFKQYKKKLKKSKNQKKPQAIEVPEIKQQIIQQEVIQEDEWNDKPKSKKQRKKQLEKQRKKDNIERKKQKQLSEQNSAQKQEEREEVSSKCSSKRSEEEIENIITQEENKKETISEILIPTTTTSAPDDEGEYVEVLNKKQHKQKRTETLKSKKQHQKKEKEFKDDQSLPDEYQHMPQLKKGSSQSVQKNGYQFEQPFFEKAPQQQRIKIKKKENGVNTVNQGVRLGLVKSIAQQKEQKTYDYDLDKSLLQKMYKTILEQKITNDVLSIYRKELDQFNKYKAAREISIMRVQHVIKSHFRYNVEAQIFGSSRTGLALQDSDVDMVVSGMPVYTKQQLYDPMRQLIDVMNQMKWTVSCKHIFQATVPLIKVIIDPSIGFLQFAGRQIYYIMNRRNPEELNLRPGEYAQHIQIDITFELSPPFQQYQMYPPYQQPWQGYHIGLKSTEFTNSICSSIHGFSEVAILLKKLLKVKDLNDSYTGGVSSFCLTIMLAAIGQDHSIGQKLINFLYKYGCNFDPDKWAIYLDEKGQNNFYNIEDEQTNQPLTIFSPINLQKIQINVTKIQMILQLFQQLYVEIMQNIDQIEPSLQKKISQKELQDYYNNHQIQKLVDLVSWQSLNLFENYLQ